MSNLYLIKPFRAYYQFTGNSGNKEIPWEGNKIQTKGQSNPISSTNNCRVGEGKRKGGGERKGGREKDGERRKREMLRGNV